MQQVLLAIFLFAAYSVYSQPSVRFYSPELFSQETSGAVCGFSSDGTTIYFVREDTLKDKLFLYSAVRKKKRWVNANILPFSGQHNDMGGRLTADGKTIYFTSDRPGGSSNPKDQWNIWVAYLQAGVWSEAQPLTEINNKGDECCPVPFEENKLLFSGSRAQASEWAILEWDGTNERAVEDINYSSGWQWPSIYYPKKKLLIFNSMKRQDSRGQDDIYVSFFDNRKWSTPINLGDPVNTEAYEDGALLSPDGRFLIFNRHATGSTPSHVMYTSWKRAAKQLNQNSK